MLQRTIKKLNTAFLALWGMILALFVCTFCFGSGGRTVLMLDCAAAFLAYLFFGRLEQELPRKTVQEALNKGRLLLAEIVSCGKSGDVRDSSFRHYRLLELNVRLIRPDGTKQDGLLVERFQTGQNGVPKGMVYVVYAEGHPEEIGLVPDALLMRTPEAEPLVRRYEADPALDIHYLHVYYDNGYRIEEMKDMIRKAENRHEQ